MYESYIIIIIIVVEAVLSENLNSACEGRRFSANFLVFDFVCVGDILVLVQFCRTNSELMQFILWINETIVCNILFG